MHKHNIKLLVQNKHNGTKKLQNMLPGTYQGRNLSVRFIPQVLCSPAW